MGCKWRSFQWLGHGLRSERGQFGHVCRQWLLFLDEPPLVKVPLANAPYVVLRRALLVLCDKGIRQRDSGLVRFSKQVTKGDLTSARRHPFGALSLSLSIQMQQSFCLGMILYTAEQWRRTECTCTLNSALFCSVLSSFNVRLAS